MGKFLKKICCFPFCLCKGILWVCGYSKLPTGLYWRATKIEKAIYNMHKAIPGNPYWKDIYEDAQIISYFFQSGRYIKTIKRK